MSFFETIWDRYRAYPRAMQWALGAAVGIIVFLAWSDLVQSQTAEWNDQADRLLANAREVVRIEQRRVMPKTLATIRGVGPVLTPRHHAEAGSMLTHIEDEVIRKHGATKDNFSLRQSVKLKRGTLEEIVGTGGRVEKLTADLRFTATPQAATAIVAELESRPEIEAISSLRITRHAGATRVTVDLVLDAWVQSGEARGPRVGGSS